MSNFDKFLNNIYNNSSNSVMYFYIAIAVLALVLILIIAISSFKSKKKKSVNEEIKKEEPIINPTPEVKAEIITPDEAPELKVGENVLPPLSKTPVVDIPVKATTFGSVYLDIKDDEPVLETKDETINQSPELSEDLNISALEDFILPEKESPALEISELVEPEPILQMPVFDENIELEPTFESRIESAADLIEEPAVSVVEETIEPIKEGIINPVIEPIIEEIPSVEIDSIVEEPIVKPVESITQDTIEIPSENLEINPDIFNEPEIIEKTHEINADIFMHEQVNPVWESEEKEIELPKKQEIYTNSPVVLTADDVKAKLAALHAKVSKPEVKKDFNNELDDILKQVGIAGNNEIPTLSNEENRILGR